MKRFFAALSVVLVLVGVADSAALCTDPPSAKSVTGVVKNAVGDPIEGVEVRLQRRDGRVVGRALSNEQGAFSLGPVAPGVYAIVGRKEGFKPATAIVTVSDAKGPAPVALAMEAIGTLTLKAISAPLSRAPNELSSAGSSQYTLTSRAIEDLPRGAYTPINDVLLQMPGVVRDENQQVHVDGEHADLQWRINGVMLPLDSFSGFGQVLNAFFIKRISLEDGVLPLNYGYRDAGVLDIETKDGCSEPGGDMGLYGGQRETVEPSFEYGGCRGKLSYYVTGLFLHDNLGFSSATPGPTPIHDLSDQGQGFGYFSYQLAPETKLSLIVGISVNDSEVPDEPGLPALYHLSGVNAAAYPSTAINESLDQQYYFATLALTGVIGPGVNYQLAYSARYSTIHFIADPVGDLIYQGVASDVFHSDLANTLEGNFSYQFGSHQASAGFYLGAYYVRLDDTTLTFPANSAGQQTSDVPLSLVSNFGGLDMLYGVYLQDIWRLQPDLRLTYGLRWDMVSGFVAGQQLSPRANLVYELNPATELHAGFGRYFQTPSFETMSPRGFSTFQDTTAAVLPGVLFPLPERDWYWDAGVVRRIGAHLTLEENAYFRLAHDLIDLGQFGYVPIFAPFNYRNGRIYGSESSLSYQWGELVLRANFTYSVAQGEDVVTGQFNFTPAELAYIQNHYAYLDHQQFYTVSANASYLWHGYLLSADLLYGSGLRAGFANTVELPANWQLNLAVARTVEVPNLGPVQARAVLVNVFDRVNLLRNGTGIGIFEPAYGPRRAAYFGLTVPLAQGGPGATTH